MSLDEQAERLEIDADFRRRPTRNCISETSPMGCLSFRQRKSGSRRDDGHD